MTKELARDTAKLVVHKLMLPILRLKNPAILYKVPGYEFYRVDRSTGSMRKIDRETFKAIHRLGVPVEEIEKYLEPHGKLE